MLEENATVDELKMESGRWDATLVRESFLANEAKEILGLPPCSNESDDRLLWHFNSSGSYSVRSGYWLVVSSPSKPSCSSMDAFESWWKFF